MTEAVKSIKVSISGREYVLEFDEQEELVRESAGRLDSAIRNISDQERDPGLREVIVAALELTLELVKIERLELEREKKVEAILKTLG